MTQETIDLKMIKLIESETGVSAKQIQAVLDLLEEGNTIPFIARYRKEATGSLDEVQINHVQQAYHYQTQLEERRQEITRLIDEQDKLTDELIQQIQQATVLQQLEDIYRPYKQKRRTKATIAKEHGLEPLAQWLQTETNPQMTPEAYAEQYMTEEVTSSEEALAGAHEIIAQEVSDRADFREFIRKYYRYNSMVTSQLKKDAEDEQSVYKMYYDFSEKFKDILPHRVLALNRAEKENVLTVKIEAPAQPVLQYLNNRFINKDISDRQKYYISLAIEDGYKRFIQPSIERELRNELTEKSDQQAIDVFAENLRHLLLQPPLKGRTVMGFDPAYRTGCKLAIIDETGKVLDKSVIYPHKPAPAKQREGAEGELVKLIEQYQVDVIAIGNGTASRESEQFVAQMIQNNQLSTQFVIVNEAGASVYSASQAARDEFPDFQVEERSAVSIARRLQDPLAELIKIDPKSLGVGQYQHDVAQQALNQTLDFTIDITVNQVGVDINTASSELLQRVSGLTSATAQNIVTYRNENGHFTNRNQIKDVKRLGPKSFQQAVGFLRILGGSNPLDQTSIHPESYATAEQILNDYHINIDTLGSKESRGIIDRIDVKEVAQDYDVGVETMQDILDGLKYPNADIRDKYDAPILRADVMTLEDLQVGMELQGVVRNVVDFGAFVDIGIKDDGLIHISKLNKKRPFKHPSYWLSVGDVIDVEVIKIDIDRHRVGLKPVTKKIKEDVNVPHDDISVTST